MTLPPPAAAAPPPGSGEDPVCSARGCRAAATHLVRWRNPRIHDAARRKTWPACDDHVEHLSGFLRARSFPVEVFPAGDRGAG
ncbi:MAG: hypothetical protein ACFCVF_04840 [Kineosporiaceae bacterium]